MGYKRAWYPGAVLSARMPDLTALEIFAAVARHGSLNAAARELNRTQQGVSARMAALEAQTGVALVSRSPSGSTLTPEGAVVAEWAARLLDLAAQMDAGIATLRADRHAHLRVAASLTIAEQLLPGWLVSFNAAQQRRSAAPPARVTLAAMNSERVAAMVRGGVADVGFVEGPRAPAGCRSRVIGHDRLVVVVPPDHPWAVRPGPVSARELARTPLVTREAGSGTREALNSALAGTFGGPVHEAEPALELSTTAAVRGAVVAGAGPAVLSVLVVGDDLAAGRLRAVPVADLDLTRDLRAVWMGSRTPPAGPVRDLIALATAPRAAGRA